VRPDLEEVLAFYSVVYNPNKSGEQAVLCPVHDERNPSCRLNLGSGLMFCNSCDFKGSSVDLIMAKEGISAQAALAFGKRFAGDGDGGLPEASRRSGRVPGGRGISRAIAETTV
jgi:DNA primase